MTPDPLGKNLAGRVLEAFDLVQVVVVEPQPERFEGLGEIREVDDPAELGVRLSLYIDPNAKRVAVQTFALVPLGYVRKQVRSLEPKLSPDLHRSGSLGQWQCQRQRQCQCQRQCQRP